MSHPERIIASISETELTKQPVISPEAGHRVVIERFPTVNNETRYRMESRLVMEPPVIAKLLGGLTGWSRVTDDLHWQDLLVPDYRKVDLFKTADQIARSELREVRDGLLLVGAMSRSVKKLARSALDSEFISKAAPAANQLASTLTFNQEYSTKRDEMPIFNTQTSMEYASDELQYWLATVSTAKLFQKLKSLGLSKKMTEVIAAFITNDDHSDDTMSELIRISGMTETELRLIDNSAILEKYDKNFMVELIHRLHDELFVDVTKRIDRKPSVRNPKNTSQLPPLHDSYESVPRVVAVPTIEWINYGNHRHLILPGTDAKEPDENGVIVRPNSIVGAAMAAYTLGRQNGIDYRQEFDRNYIGLRDERRKGLPRAGFFPLVAWYNQDRLLSDPYFSSAEEAVK